MKEHAGPFSLYRLGEHGEEYAARCGAWCDAHRDAMLDCAAGVLVTLLLGLIALVVLKRLVAPLVGRRRPAAGEEIAAVAAPAALLLLLTGWSLSFDLIPFPGRWNLFFDRLFYALMILTVLGLLLRAITCASELLLAHFRQRHPESYSMNKLLLDLSRSIIKLAVWSGAFIFILQDVFQMKVTHILASAGILGLAIAFAAQNTIANLFGAFSILGSKLFKVGDWIKTGETEGIVEQIGFRSIRIRAFSGRLIDIPNRLIADSQLENFSDRPFWREHFRYGLVYQTTPEQIRLALGILEEIGRDLEDLMVPERPVKFDLIDCGSYSLDLDGFVWFNAPDWFAMRAARSRFNQEVFRRFNAAGLSFAYPTSTVFLNQDADTETPRPDAT